MPTSWIQYIDELRLTREWESEDEHMDEVGILVYSNGPSTVYQPDRTCEACMKKLIGNKFPQRGVTPACDHDAAICLECLEESIKSQPTTGVEVSIVPQSNEIRGHPKMERS